MIYCMSDIHGMYSRFNKMLKKIDFKKSDTLYILGDVVDRGPEPVKCIKTIMENNNIKMIMGNHEDMMLRSIINNSEIYKKCWLLNGGGYTLCDICNVDKSEGRKIIDFLARLPDFIILDKYIFVHAGIVPKKADNVKELLKNQTSEEIMWTGMKPKNSGGMLSSYTIIYGHVPTYFMTHKIPVEILRTKNCIDIDCGCGFKEGRLGCLRLNDGKEFYVS